MPYGKNFITYKVYVQVSYIVFITKYRRKVIYNQLRKDIQKYIKLLCRWKGVEIIEGHMMPDHIHILVKIPPRMSV